MRSRLEQSILNTIRYFDVFGMPVTATQIWWSLIKDGEDDSFDTHPSLPAVQRVLHTSEALNEVIQTKWGYYFMRGKGGSVRARLARHNTAQDKWKIAVRCARILACVPFVRALAGSGSLALDNTKEKSDLDMLVITHPRRIWTARLLLLLVSQLLGRRRKHFNAIAPDKLCLNHYVSEKSLELPPEIHNIYNAVQYRHLVALYGVETVRQFQHENARWIDEHVQHAPYTALPMYNTIRLPKLVEWTKQQLELILLEPVGNSFEKLAEKLQRAIIARHTTSREGRIMLSAGELAFHPDTKAPAILAAFQKNS